MTFSEFIQLLFSAIGAGNSTHAFARSVLDAIVTEEGSEIIAVYKDSTFKSYYNGNTEITKLARKINAYIDKTEFEEYLKHFSDDVFVNLCNSFVKYIPDINPNNAGEKLSELLVSIITAAACTNKKRTPKGAEESNDIDPDASTAIILGSDGVAPDLGAFVDGTVLYLNCDNADAQKGVFDEYISKASEHYNNVKTPLSADNPFPFYDVYVCNDLYNRFLPKAYKDQKISDATVASLIEISKFIIISGTGGIGKSMLMKHLFFTSVADCKGNGLLPILLPLRKYDESIQDLTEFIYRIVAEFDRGVSQEDITKLLKGGKCILLLDGLDEVVSSVRSRFETALEAMIKQYPENTYILSSRPTSTFLSFPRFTVLNMRSFDKGKALEMIDKLPYHDAEAKAKFRGDLDKKLFKSHQQFASNPLLLTIMLMTYTTNGNIPQKRHVFYSQAYDVMARKHDSSDGSYVRPMHTGLDPEDFAKYYAEFCARTYKDEIYEFTEQSFSTYMDKVLAANGLKNSPLTSKQFLLDITDNLCIMYREGEYIYFIHRSFQEYFCARFFSVQMDDTLAKTARIFENHNDRSYTDRAFDMLYDMIPDKIDRYIFLPYLTDLWRRCDENDGYWTFLQEIYPVIYSQQGETEDYNETNPEEFFYDFVVNENRIRYNGQLVKIDWPPCADMDKKQWVHVFTGEIETRNGTRYAATKLCELESAHLSEDYIEEYGEPEIEGESWEIEPAYVFDSPYRKSMKTYMESDEFPLMKEYKACGNIRRNCN